MIKKYVSQILRLSLTLAVVFTVAGWLPFHAHVTINSSPQGASVYKAGESDVLGVTPYKTHIFHTAKRFDVRKEGFIDEQVLLDHDSAEHVLVKLTARPILLYSKPGADIYEVDAAKPLGKTPLEMDVYVDDHTYTLKAEGYYDKDVIIGLNSKDPLVVELEHKPVITIETDPADAKIYMVGSDELLGTGSLTLILEEKAGFEIKADRYYSETINLEPKTQTANITLKAMPYVMITSKPIGAKVSIGGKSIGTAPVEQLIEKATTVELSLDGYITKTVTLDGTDRNSVITLEEVPPPEPEPEPEPAETNAAPAAL